jgi:hypothetical protein
MRLQTKWYTRTDLLYYLLWPAMSCLVLPVVIFLTWVILFYNVTRIDASAWAWVAAFVIGYALAFAANIVLGFHYRARSRDISIARTLVLVHVMAVYQFVWFFAGWWSVLRILFRRGGWSKTERLAVPASST